MNRTLFHTGPVVDQWPSVFINNAKRPNVVVESLTFLLRIREVTASNLNRRPCLLSKVSCGFPQYLQANSGLVP
jgi:hypothetical protein